MNFFKWLFNKFFPQKNTTKQEEVGLKWRHNTTKKNKQLTPPVSAPTIAIAIPIDRFFTPVENYVFSNGGGLIWVRVAEIAEMQGPIKTYTPLIFVSKMIVDTRNGEVLRNITPTASKQKSKISLSAHTTLVDLPITTYYELFEALGLENYDQPTEEKVSQ